jgi:hypothetical protein
MAWHHIIPYPVLRDVWNRLVDQHIATQLAEARVAIRQYLLLCNRNQPKLDDLIDRMRAESLACHKKIGCLVRHGERSGGEHPDRPTSTHGSTESIVFAVVD